ncbi:MAG: hypothetical protein WCA07_14685 [Gloeobacterales cyanobacterium]
MNVLFQKPIQEIVFIENLILAAQKEDRSSLDTIFIALKNLGSHIDSVMATEFEGKLLSYQVEISRLWQLLKLEQQFLKVSRSQKARSQHFVTMQEHLNKMKSFCEACASLLEQTSVNRYE